MFETERRGIKLERREIKETRRGIRKKKGDKGRKQWIEKEKNGTCYTVE